MKRYSTSLCLLLLSVFVIGAFPHEELREVVVGVRLDLYSAPEKTWLKGKVQLYTGQTDNPLKTALTYYMEDHEWKFDWWPVKQWRSTGKNVTKAKVKTAVDYTNNTHRLFIDVVDHGMAHATIKAAGFTNTFNPFPPE